MIWKDIKSINEKYLNFLQLNSDPNSISKTLGKQQISYLAVEFAHRDEIKDESTLNILSLPKNVISNEGRSFDHHYTIYGLL
jgi:hypothetical protein